MTQDTAFVLFWPAATISPLSLIEEATLNNQPDGASRSRFRSTPLCEITGMRCTVSHLSFLVTPTTSPRLFSPRASLSNPRCPRGRGLVSIQTTARPELWPDISPRLL